MNKFHKLCGVDGFFIFDKESIYFQVDNSDINGLGHPNEMLGKWCLVIIPNTVIENKEFLYFNTEIDVVLYHRWGYKNLVIKYGNK